MSIKFKILILGLISVSFWNIEVRAVNTDAKESAIAYTKETWENVDQHARRMAIRDLNQFVGEVLEQLNSVVFDKRTRDEIFNTLIGLTEEFSTLGSETDSSGQAQQILIDKITRIRTLTSKLYRVSGLITDWNTERQKIIPALQSIAKKFEEKSIIGSIEPGIMYSTRAMEIPEMAYDISGTYSNNFIQFDFRATSGSGHNQKQEDRREGIMAVTTTIGVVNPLAGIAVAAVSAVVDFFISKQERNELMVNASDAAAYMSSNRAHTNDIILKYREYSSMLKKVIETLSAYLNLDSRQRMQALTRARSREFNEKFHDVRAKMKELGLANCRVNLFQKTCWEDGQPLEKMPEYVDDPICGVIGQSNCIKIPVWMDPFCRQKPNGVKYELDQSCEVDPATYESSTLAKKDADLVKVHKLEIQNLDAFLKSRSDIVEMASLDILRQLEDADNFSQIAAEYDLSAQNARRSAIGRLDRLLVLIQSNAVFGLFGQPSLFAIKGWEDLRNRYFKLPSRTVSVLLGLANRDELIRDLSLFLKDANALSANSRTLWSRVALESEINSLLEVLK